ICQSRRHHGVQRHQRRAPANAILGRPSRQPGNSSQLRSTSADCYKRVKDAASGHGCGYNVPVKPHISVVEDDPDISRLVRHHLEGAGFAVNLYPTGNAILAESERQRPTLFILDIMVPGKDGLELCRQIRQTQSLAMIPVIFPTAKSSEADRVLGLELGADDYIPKPFSPRELVARVKAVLRRFERPLAPGPVRVGEIEIDPVAMTLTVGGKLVTTTATEFRLLEYFVRHLGRVFTRDQLL